mmetsp:Transcript_2170/g.2942  ORF Transcript_2170/g.2942 Transcript_2170/m.2942 type:complete len:139 (+) Transcript_2170:121-537(+)
MFLHHSLFAALIITMLSSLTRAFTISTTSQHARAILRQNVTPTATTFARFMSTNDGDETTIVQTCTDKIKKALETDNVKVTGAYDDPNGSHISIEVISDLFTGKRAVQRQQLVYKALWDELQGPVHAVDSMICKTPDE